MLRQFKDLSTWREDTFSVKAKSVGTLDFMDTKPNQFVIQNGNHYPLYIGIGSTPSDKNYEFKIGANANDVFGRPTPTNKIMFYNPSDSTMVIRVFSVYQEFDILTLKNMTANIQNATVETDGMVRGFSQGVKLPSGDNLIGKVELAVDQFQKIDELENGLKSILENSNHVPTIEEKLNETKNSIESVKKTLIDLRENQKEFVGFMILNVPNGLANVLSNGYEFKNFTMNDGSNAYLYELEYNRIYLKNNTDKYMTLGLPTESFTVQKGETLEISNEKRNLYGGNNVSEVDGEMTYITEFSIDLRNTSSSVPTSGTFEIFIDVSIYRTLKEEG